MAPILVPINGSVLAWALNEASWDAEDLAEQLGVSPRTVEAWLSGQEQPSTTVFRKIAKALQRPTSVFFLPKPPAASNVPISFRAAPTAEDRELTKQEADAIRQARRVQRITSWLREKTGAPGAALPGVASNAAAVEAAEIVREFFHWSLDRQTQAASPTAVTHDIRQTIESTGVIVMQFSLGKKGCRGFSLDNSTTPLIAANSAYNTQARAYSYLHEFGHALRHTESLCVGPMDHGVERWCEEFAAAFLLPRADLIAYVNDLVGRRQPITDPSQITRTANYFKVSRLATATALRQLSRASELLWLEIKRQAELAMRGGGPATEPQTSPVIRLREWGRTPIRLLLDAEDRRTLSRADVQEYLRLSVTQLNEVRSRLDQPIDSE